MSAMKLFDMLVALLLVVGGVNWGLIGLFQYDLVAAIFGGLKFGEMNAAIRTIYIIVGLAAVYQILSLRAIQHRWGVMFRTPKRAGM
ncbi:MAG TPA: DUF378 domain-containing protein [Thermoguttaceae bacterium]|nr:DUF378 domain-containing protein [Thermoguttaceae bacterium]